MIARRSETLRRTVYLRTHTRPSHAEMAPIDRYVPGVNYIAAGAICEDAGPYF